MLRTADYGTEYLQNRIVSEFALARHIGIVVESAGDHGIVLRAPLAPNANYKGTAFGGSLYSIAVLTGWAWVTCYLAARELGADTVIQDSTMRFLTPVKGELLASASAPSASQIDKFLKMLQRAGRGRIELRVDIQAGQTVAALFDGVFAAVMRT